MTEFFQTVTEAGRAQRVGRPTTHENHTGDWTKALSTSNMRLPQRGELRHGEVIAVQPDAILVDVGAKRDAVIPGADLRQVSRDLVANLAVGDEVPVYVVKPFNRQDDLIVSLRLGLAQQDWLHARRAMESGTLIEARVTGHNRGGLLARYRSLEVFVPHSLCLRMPRGGAADELMEAKQARVGQSISLKLIEVSRRRRRLVGSERAARQQRRRERLLELEPGETRTGVVDGLAKYGAFVDLGDITGLVHISELAQHYVDHPSEIVQVGEPIQVVVLDVDLDRERIRLSRKAALADAADYP
jgi:small subunit ribosomal protein S1